MKKPTALITALLLLCLTLLPALPGVPARAAQDYYNVSVTTDGHGTVTADPALAAPGSAVCVNARPESGYVVDSITWTADGVSRSVMDGGCFIMPEADVDVFAAFRPMQVEIYRITVVSGPGGSAAAPESAAYDFPVTVNVYPDAGYELERLTYTANNVTKTVFEGTSFIMPQGDVTVNATFRRIGAAQHLITVSCGPGGTALVSAAAAESGDTVTVSVYPETGYAVDTVTYTAGGITRTAADLSFVMPDADVAVSVTFKPLAPAADRVTAAESEGGRIELSDTSAAPGDYVTVTVYPDAGFTCASLSVVDEQGQTVPTLSPEPGVFSFIMPAAAVTVSAVFTADSCPAAPYTDVDTGLWYHEGIDFVLSRGLMKGVAADRFAPDGTLDRAMLVTILFRLEGEPAVSGGNTYSDVAAGSWYEPAVRWADANGIVSGYGNGSFGPGDSITREQMAAMLMRYAAYRGRDTRQRADLSAYADSAEISAWALTSLQWANAAGLINGRSAALLAPRGTTTRAEAATILQRFCASVL